MIKTLSDIADVFCVFHDGVVADHARAGDTLTLRVEIEYLAQRVNPAYTWFSVTLHDAGEVTFSPWPRSVSDRTRQVTRGDAVLGTRMDILEATSDRHGICITCNQADPAMDFCGGELSLSCSGATVADPGGREYTIEELRQLSQDYWEEWAKRNGTHEA